MDKFESRIVSKHHILKVLTFEFFENRFGFLSSKIYKLFMFKIFVLNRPRRSLCIVFLMLVQIDAQMINIYACAPLAISDDAIFKN